MKNEVLNNLNPSTLDTNIELIKTEKNVIYSILNSVEESTSDIIDKENNIENASDNTIDTNLDDGDNKLNNDIDNTTNCLALTVRENYHVVVVKNFFRKSARMSWKVALSIFTINFLNMFL